MLSDTPLFLAPLIKSDIPTMDTTPATPVKSQGFFFTDAKGRLWDLALNLRIAKTIDKMEFDEAILDKEKKFCFVKPRKEDFQELINNTPFLFAVIWGIIQPQVVKEFIAGRFPYDPRKPEQYDQAELEFVEGVTGSVIEAGREAFWRSLADFFPDQKTVLQTLLRHYLKAIEAASRQLSESEDRITKAIDSMMGKGVEAGILELENFKPGETSPPS
jgi:hypothetical protein